MRWVFVFITFVALAQPAWALSPQELVGTWKMLSTVRQSPGSDKAVDNLGAHPLGVMIMTPDFRFMIIETADGRQAAASTDGYASLQRSELAYSGLASFSPDPGNPNGLRMVNKVDIAWNEEWKDTDQVRLLSLDGNRLTIHTELIKSPLTGERTVSTLVFERSK